jgi:hypothetical protein
MDMIMGINAVLAGLALFYGLYSRSLGTAFVAGFLIALAHTAMIALAMAQGGESSITEAPVLANLLDTFMKSGYANFAHARIVAYLVATAGILLSVTVVAFIFSWIVAGIVGFVVPKKVSA